MIPMRQRLVRQMLGGGAVSKTVLQDLFTGDNGDLLTAHTPDVAPAGSSWGATFSTYSTLPAITIQSNRAGVPNGAVAVGCSVIESGLADVSISGQFLIPVGDGVGGTGIIFRYTDATHYLIAELSSNFTATPNTGTIKLVRRNGTNTTLTTVSNVNLIHNTLYPFQLILSGDSITLYVAGKTATATDTFQATATKHGISIIRTPGGSGGVDGLLMSADLAVLP